MKVFLLELSLVVLLRSFNVFALHLQTSSSVVDGNLRGTLEFNEGGDGALYVKEDEQLTSSHVGSQSTYHFNTEKLSEFFPKNTVIDFETRKYNAAEKRQQQRDNRREKSNPYRTAEEERRERERKHNQRENSGRKDPYYDDEFGGKSEFGNDRDRHRRKRCRKYGLDCDYDDYLLNDDDSNLYEDDWYGIHVQGLMK